MSKWSEKVILWFGMPKLCNEAVAIATAIEIYWLRSVNNAIQPRLDWGSEGRISKDRITRSTVFKKKFHKIKTNFVHKVENFYKIYEIKNALLGALRSLFSNLA